jgi:hypothetical protein
MSALDDWLLFAPLWLIGLVAFAGMMAASLLGAALRRRQDTRASRLPKSELSSDADEGLMVSAVLGLLALLVAFTFSIAISRFDDRRANVVNEANAIGTTYLRAQLLDPPHRETISRLLAEYTEVRILLASSNPSAGTTRLMNKSDLLVAELWKATVVAFPSMRPYNSVLFVEAMNGLIDMDAVRKAGRRAHVPSTVFLALMLYQFMAAGVISYAVTGRGGRRTGIVLFVLLGALLILIIDVDRPTSGGITEDQRPMLELREFMFSHPPESFARINMISPATLPN